MGLLLLFYMVVLPLLLRLSYLYPTSNYVLRIGLKLRNHLYGRILRPFGIKGIFRGCEVRIEKTVRGFSHTSVHKRSSPYADWMLANSIPHRYPCGTSAAIFETTFTRRLLYSWQPTCDVWHNDVLNYRKHSRNHAVLYSKQFNTT